jgi:hypothetical protein
MLPDGDSLVTQQIRASRGVEAQDFRPDRRGRVADARYCDPKLDVSHMPLLAPVACVDQVFRIYDGEQANLRLSSVIANFELWSLLRFRHYPFGYATADGPAKWAVGGNLAVRSYGREPISVRLNYLLGILFRPMASVAKTSFMRRASKPFVGLRTQITGREIATYGANQCSSGMKQRLAEITNEIDGHANARRRGRSLTRHGADFETEAGATVD